jgi:hypothetical protein
MQSVIEQKIYIVQYWYLYIYNAETILQIILGEFYMQAKGDYLD